MGSVEDSDWSFIPEDEQPVHRVSIGYSFYMQMTEVTQAQWKAVMSTDPSQHAYRDDNWPVETISWDSCHQFIDALNQLGEGTFRLPSEAEWEYACRAGTTTRFYYGNSDCNPGESGCTWGCDLSDHAWWCGSPGYSVTRAVAQKIPNPFGLYDMYGNVHEWCEDDWYAGYDGAPTDGSAWVGTPRGDYRIVRGGYYANFASRCRSSSRSAYQPSSANSWFGARLVRDPGP
jgi:formylglycine-generating enzyme required for sulfatase activity